MIRRVELLVTHVVQLLQYIHKHRLFSLDICLVGVTHEVHVHFSRTSLLLVLDRSMERVFLVELVKVLVTYFRGYCRDIWGSLCSQPFPVGRLEEGVILDLFCAMFTKTVIGVTNQSLEDVDRCCRQLSLGRNAEGFLPMHNLLTGDGGLIREEGRITNEHLEEDAADRPPVNCFIVAILPKYFRSNIVRGSYS